jgi:hypothetical protein
MILTLRRLAPGGAVVMTSVTVMHEEMHQGTGGQKKKRQEAGWVCPMLRDEKKASDREEANKNDAAARTPPRLLGLICHFVSPSLTFVARGREPTIRGRCR